MKNIKGDHLVYILKHLTTIFLSRPFDLKGGRRYGFLFRSEIFISDNTRELEYLFILSRKARIFFSRIQH
jgi:hypothetical protein